MPANLDEAEAMLQQGERSASRRKPAVYQQLAGFYQRQGEFDKLIEAVAAARRCSSRNNPEAHYAVATYYWDEAYRNTRLNEGQQKRNTWRRALTSVEKALELNPDYVEAVTYKVCC